MSRKNDEDVVYVDAETEEFARLLTLAFHDVNPKVNLGLSYEAILSFLIDTLERGVNDIDAHKLGKKILRSAKIARNESVN